MEEEKQREEADKEKKFKQRNKVLSKRVALWSAKKCELEEKQAREAAFLTRRLVDALSY